MNIRRRTLLVIGILGILMIGCFYVFSQALLMNGFSQLERNDVSVNTQRAVSNLQSDLADLQSKTCDWAQWDDSYQFIQGLNPGYYQANVVQGSFINNRVDIMLFVNDSGSVVCSRAFNYSTGAEMQVPQSLLNMFSANPSLWNFSSTNSGIVGIVILPEGPLMIASYPITTSEGKGPIEGALVMSRYLDSYEVQSLSNISHMPMQIYHVNDPTMPSYFMQAQAQLLAANGTAFLPLNASLAGGYSLLRDVFGNPALILGIEVPRSIYNQGQNTVGDFTIGLVIVVVISISAFMVILDDIALSPLAKLTLSVKKIGEAKNASLRLSVNGDDELSTLGTAINGMLSEIEDKTSKLKKSERLAAIGELAAMIGHDLRNPLTGIENSAYYLKRKLGLDADENTTKVLALIDNDVKYSNKIINDLLEYSRDIRLDLEELTPNSLMVDSLKMVKAPPGIQIADKTENSPKIMVDKVKIQRVFINMINNAFDAMPKGGTLTLSNAHENGTVDFLFSDTGIGMTKEVQAKLWTPLFTTKAKGMGFGLPICKRIVEAHKGAIKVESETGRGTTFTISLPTNRPNPEVKNIE